MLKSFSVDLAGRKLTVETDRVAAQANDAAFMYYGNIVVPATVTASSKPREGINFFPLSVEYGEKLYSAGKIPGGFNKRKGRASKSAILACRAISHPMRPPFSKDYRGNIMLDNVVVSVDPGYSPELTAMLGSAIATSISNTPFIGPRATTQVGLVNGEFVINPIADQKQVSDMALTAVSTREKMIMTEAGANEVPGQQMINAIFRTYEVNQEIIRFIDAIVTECDREEHTYEDCTVPGELFAAIKEIVPPSEMEEVVFTDDKQTRERSIAAATGRLEETFADSEEWLPVPGEAIYQYQKKTVRRMILKGHKRSDGRAIDWICHLAAEVDLPSKVHDSGMFTRGQTRILNACILAPLSDVQRIDGPGRNETDKRYVHHYNSPSFSVGETKPGRGPERHEIGHGVLAEKALIPVLPSAEGFPCAIRTMSKTMESNGSTSQASIRASTLSLIAAGVPVREMVTSISCGLMTGDTNNDYIVLTDIQGLENFFGDMDFRVGGTKDGIAAIQVDIKIHGLTRPITEETITRTKKTRIHILENVMKPVTSRPKKHLSPYAPKIKQISIDPQEISDMIDRRGKVVSKIIEETRAKTGITDDDSVSVCGTDKTVVDKAITIITGIVTDIEAGMVFNGKIVRIMSFDAFVELVPNKDGMIHISKLFDKRVDKVEDVVNTGNEIIVKVTEVDKMGRINLTMRLSGLAGKKEEAATEK